MGRALTHVFHLAGVAFVPEATRDPIRAFDINLNGTVRIADAMRSQTPEARLLFAGSSGVYGAPQTVPITEAHALAPQSPYDISKSAADHYLGYVHKAEEFQVLRMRVFNHSGPGQSEDFVLPSFARQVARIEAGLDPPIIRVGNLSARRDFCHVADVVRAVPSRGSRRASRRGLQRLLGRVAPSAGSARHPAQSPPPHCVQTIEPGCVRC